MTKEEIEAITASQKEAADLTAALSERLKAAEGGRPTPEAVKAAADRLVAAGAIDANLRERAAQALSNHAETLDFLVNLADDRAKVASAYRDLPELNPGSSGYAPTADADADAEFDASLAKLKAQMAVR